jgi:hypothetical protein
MFAADGLEGFEGFDGFGGLDEDAGGLTSGTW